MACPLRVHWSPSTRAHEAAPCVQSPVNRLQQQFWWAAVHGSERFSIFFDTATTSNDI